MTDTPTTRVLMRKQSIGSNTNTWGDTKLNDNLDNIDRASQGYQSLAMTGDTTLGATSYSATNDGKVKNLVLTGTLTSAATLTVLSVEWSWDSILNMTGAAITVKTSAGTGISIPNGTRTALYCDGTNVVARTANYIANYAATLANAGDVVVKTTLETAIATASLPATAGTMLNTASDTTAGYASTKITALTLGGLVRSTLNPGGNEQNQFALDFTNLTATTNIAATDRFAVYDATAVAMRYQTRANAVGKFGLILQASSATQAAITAGSIYPLDCTAGVGSATWPASASLGDVFGLLIFGTGGWSMNTNSLNYYGTAYSALTGSPEGVQFFMYSGASRGWIDL